MTIIIFAGRKPSCLKIAKKYILKTFGSAPIYTLAVVIIKTVVQKNRIKTLHHNGNPLEQKRRCSNIPGRLHQSPAAKLA